jgi:hypothetical protein
VPSWTSHVIFSHAFVVPPSVWLRGTTPGGDELELEIPVQVLQEEGITIHQLAARNILQELEEGSGYLHSGKYGADKDTDAGKFDHWTKQEGVRVGVTYKVGSKWTSFVAVQEKSGKEAEIVSGFVDDSDFGAIDSFCSSSLSTAFRSPTQVLTRGNPLCRAAPIWDSDSDPDSDSDSWSCKPVPKRLKLGFFCLTSLLATLLGIQLETLQKKLTWAGYNNTEEKMWATVLVLRFFENELMSTKDVWEPVADEAQDWLAQLNKEEMVTMMTTMAEEIGLAKV